jgi:glycine/D-amino acid oxidase-like deaminating enzyme
MIDFLIIGGGIAGLSAGAYLSELGQCVILEQEDALAYHASGRSAALFEENYGHDTTVILNAASRAHFEAHDLLSLRGLMVVGGADTADAFARDCTALKLSRISMDEAKTKLPILNDQVVDRAGYHPDAWDIDTDRLIQGFARQIRDNGGQIHVKSPVDQITRIDQSWEVHAGQVWQARVVINAAGPWADQVAELAGIAPIGLVPCRRSMARIPAPGGLDVSHWPMTIGAGETWYCKPDAGALIVSPADADPTTPHDAWADDMVLAEGLAQFEAVTTEPVTRMLANWAGLRTFSPDRGLVLGPDGADPGFIWAAGQGGFGMQSSPAAGRLIADLVAGHTPAIPQSVIDRLSPVRFS